MRVPEAVGTVRRPPRPPPGGLEAVVPEAVGTVRRPPRPPPGVLEAVQWLPGTAVASLSKVLS